MVPTWNDILLCLNHPNGLGPTWNAPPSDYLILFLIEARTTVSTSSQAGWARQITLTGIVSVEPEEGKKKFFFPGQWVHTDRQADGSKEEQVGRGTANLSAAQCGARRERRSAHCIRHTDTQKVISTKPLYYFTCSRLTVLGGLIHSFCKHNVVVWTQLTVTLHSQLLWRRTTVKGFILKYL